MTEQDERIERATIHFVFTGQPTSEWPAWMVFLNFAYDGHSRIVVHRLDDILEIRAGDTIHRRADGQLTVARSNILRFPEAVATLDEPEDNYPADTRTEKTMTF